jgi:hypothetical protein
MEAGRSRSRTLHAVRVLRIPHGLRCGRDGRRLPLRMYAACSSGLLWRLGAGRRRPEDVPTLLAAADRPRAPPALPPRCCAAARVRVTGNRGPSRPADPGRA